MEWVERKAYAKVNLGLDVLRKRPDGYHDVRMIMQTVDIYDELWLGKRKEQGILLQAEDADVPEDEVNLAYQAARLMREQFSITQGVEIKLKKNIPIAAGMAGGSSDAAAVLQGMNQLFELGLQDEELCRLGVQLGADVPYCIKGKTALSEGIGEILTPVAPPPECVVVIAKPACSVSTKYVYENLKLDEGVVHPDIDGLMEAMAGGDLRGMTAKMGNILESVTVRKYPVIGEIKDFLRGKGAWGALMSGSGPTVFAVFAKGEQERAAAAARELGEAGLAKDIYVTAFI